MMLMVVVVAVVVLLSWAVGSSVPAAWSSAEAGPTRRGCSGVAPLSARATHCKFRHLGPNE